MVIHLEFMPEWSFFKWMGVHGHSFQTFKFYILCLTIIWNGQCLRVFAPKHVLLLSVELLILLITLLLFCYWILCCDIINRPGASNFLHQNRVKWCRMILFAPGAANLLCWSNWMSYIYRSPAPPLIHTDIKKVFCIHTQAVHRW